MNSLTKDVIRLAFWNTMNPTIAPLNVVGFAIDVKQGKYAKK